MIIFIYFKLKLKEMVIIFEIRKVIIKLNLKIVQKKKLILRKSGIIFSFNFMS